MSQHRQRGLDGGIDISETARQRQEYQQGQRERQRAQEASRYAVEQLMRSQEAVSRSTMQAGASRVSGGAAPAMSFRDWVQAGMLFGAIGLAGYHWLAGLAQSWSQLAQAVIAGIAAGAVAGAVLYVVALLLRMVFHAVAVVIAWGVGAVLVVAVLQAWGIL